ncbi:MAG: hypothetical protein JW963_09920, partial [Anaerolineales bacterium]|nr:hypothetical protein [Anaerolineales bacterium]
AYEAVESVKPHNVRGRVDRITAYFFEPEPREAFFRLFKELQMAYEVLSPDAFLRPYIDDYALITDIYLTAYNTFDPKAQQQRLERDLLRKTDALIREHVSSGPVAEPLPLYPINRNIADVVHADDVPNQVKVINLHRSLIAHIQQAGEAQPFLLSIAEEVEEVIEQLRQRQIGIETALAELQAKAEKVVHTEEERARSPLDNLAFSLRMVLRASDLVLDDDGIDALAEDLSVYLRDNEGWRYNEGVERQVRFEIYGRLLPYIEPFDAARAKVVVNNLLRMQEITA